MTQYYTDFSEYLTGGTPRDWTPRWVLGGSTLSIVGDAAATGGQILRHVVTEDSRRAWAWQAVPGADSVEVLAKIRCDDRDGRLGVIARGSGLGTKRGGECGWTSELDFEGSRFRTCSYDPARSPRPYRPHGIGNIFGESDFAWEADRWYWLRLQLTPNRGFVAARSRVWDATMPEPSTWQHSDDRSDPDHVGRKGWVGITGQTTRGLRDYDVFSVGTDGDPAPTQPL